MVAGKINFEKPGEYTLKLFAQELNEQDSAGLGMTRVIFKKRGIEDFGF